MQHQTQPRSRAILLLDALLIVSLLVLTFLFGCFKQKDADIWWHLKAGKMILERGSVPRHDWFTFTSAEETWIDLHWLFQIAAAKLHALGGMELLTLVSATLGTLAVGIQIVARHPRASVPITVACWYAFLFLLSGRLYVRPEVVTLVCMSCFLAMFHQADGRAWWWLAALVPIQILWVNVQGLFILGLILAGIYWFDGIVRFLQKQPDAAVARRTLLLGALVGASLLNPYRLDGLVFPIELFRKMSWDSEFYSRHISELQSIPQFITQTGFQQFYMVIHLALLIAGAASFVISWSANRFSVFRIVTFSVFAWLSFQATRNSGQFALAAGAVTAWNLAELMAARRQGSGATPGHAQSGTILGWVLLRHPSGASGGWAAGTSAVAGRAGLAAIVLVTCWTVTSGRFYAFAGEGRLFGLGEHPLWHGHAAAQFAAQPGMPERMLAFHLGQAAVFEFHMGRDQYTFADPRLEVVSRELLAQYHTIEQAMREEKPEDSYRWRTMLRNYRIEMILIDHETHSEIDATLMSAPEWRCVYFDPVAAVYLHREAKTQPAPSPVNFPSALFQTNGDQQGDVRMPSHDKTVMAVQLDPRFREATALHRIAGNLLLREQRGQSFDLQLARSMLLLARSRTDAVNASHHSYELDRLRGQISFALHPLTGRQLRTNEFESFIWDSAAMLDLGRARYFLERARQQRPDDFSTLAYLYELSSVQLDRDAQRRFGNELIQTGARNAAQRGVLQSVIADHRLARDPDAAQPPVDLNTVTDIDTARRLVSQYLATQQPQLAQRALLACRQRLGRLPWDLAERLADLSLFLGSPGTGLEPRSIEGHFDESKLLARRGTAQLVMASLRTSVETYEAALELDSGNLEACFGLARAYLELGDAARSMAYCQRALALTSNDDETRHNLDWMTDLVGRSVPP